MQEADNNEIKCQIVKKKKSQEIVEKYGKYGQEIQTFFSTNQNKHNVLTCKYGANGGSLSLLQHLFALFHDKCHHCGQNNQL